MLTESSVVQNVAAVKEEPSTLLRAVHLSSLLQHEQIIYCYNTFVAPNENSTPPKRMKMMRFARTV